MENPEVRAKPLKGTKRISVKSASSEMFHKDSSQVGSNGLLHLVKTSPRYLDPTVSSLNLAGKAAKDKTPRLSDFGLQTRRLSENFQEKGTNKLAELESHIFQLESKLDIVKDQLISAELLKKEAQKDAEESRKQLSELSKKFEESRKEVSDSATLVSVLDEIKLLKSQIESEYVFESARRRQSEFNQKQLHQLREELQKAYLVLEELKKNTDEAKIFEAQALETMDATLFQLLEAKIIAEVLRAESYETKEACEAVALDLEHSKLQANCFDDQNEPQLDDEMIDEMDVASLKLELEGLKSALEATRIRYDEEIMRKEEETEDAVQIMKIISSASKQRRDELEADIRRSKTEIDQLTENLLDMEEKLQSSHKKNSMLAMQLKSKGHRKLEIQMELNNLKAETESLKAHLTMKEMELENAATESTTLKLCIKKISESKLEREASLELEKTKKEVERVAEELETVERENADTEYELRKLKMQSDQWRKAAEVAASIVAADNEVMFSGKLGSPVRLSYADEDMQKKRNGNLLKKFGVLWKKQHK